MKTRIHLYFIASIFVMLFSCTPKYKSDVEKDLDILDAANLNPSDKKKTLDSIYSRLQQGYNVKADQDLYFRIANNYHALKEMDSYLTTVEKVKLVAEKYHDSARIARAYYYRAEFYKNTTVLDSAFSNYVKSLKICTALKDSVHMGQLILSKAGILYDTGIYTEAEIDAVNALRMVKKFKQTEFIYEAHLSIGLSLNEMHDYPKALEYMNLAMQDLDQMEDENFDKQLIINSRSYTYNNIGLVYRKQKQFAKAIQYFKLGMKSKDLKNESPENYAVMLDNMAYCNMKLGNHNGVLQSLLKALEIRNQSGNKPGMVSSNLALGEYFIIKKDSAQALRYLENGYKLAKAIRSNTEIIRSLKLLAENDVKRQAFYTTRYFEVDDSLQNIDKNTRNKFARIAFETEELEKENKNLRLRNKIIFISIGVILIAFGITVLLFRLKNKNRELQHAREQKESNETIYNLIMGQQDMKEDILNEERSRMGRELHDGVVNNIFTTRFALANLPSSDEKQKQILIDELKRTELEIRKVSHDLNEKFLFEDASVPNIIESLIDSQQKISKTHFNLNIDKQIDWTLVPSEAKVHIYRIIQESIQNIHKYAKAKNCTIEISKIKEDLDVKIWDDGRGFDVKNANDGIGLKNIKDRVKLLKGNLNINSEKGKGAHIEFSFEMEKRVEKPGGYRPIALLSDEEYENEDLDYLNF